MGPSQQFPKSYVRYPELLATMSGSFLCVPEVFVMLDLEDAVYEIDKGALESTYNKRGEGELG